MKEVWWVNENSSPHRKRNRQLKGGKNRGFRVFLCKVCNKVFENVYAEGSTQSLFYYEDFPRYGLEKHKCPKCKNGK